LVRLGETLYLRRWPGGRGVRNVALRNIEVLAHTLGLTLSGLFDGA